MKLTVTVEVIGLEDLSARRHAALPEEMKLTISKMPFSEKGNKSLLFVESFLPRIIDNKAVSRYFPMLVPRTFQDALGLIKENPDLYLERAGGLKVYWVAEHHKFLDNGGVTWIPSPAVILSDKEEWYVNSKVEPNQTETKIPKL